jgi:hypothetical protein
VNKYIQEIMYSLLVGGELRSMNGIWLFGGVPLLFKELLCNLSILEFLSMLTFNT